MKNTIELIELPFISDENERGRSLCDICGGCGTCNKGIDHVVGYVAYLGKIVD